MRDFLAVGTGGFLGAVSRYYLGGLVLHLSGGSRFPWSTLAVNLVGCFLIGLLAGTAEVRHVLSPPMRLLLLTGFLGGFTTFSAFGYETWFLWREHTPLLAGANVLLHLAVALPAVWIGHRLAVLLPVT